MVFLGDGQPGLVESAQPRIHVVRRDFHRESPFRLQGSAEVCQHDFPGGKKSFLKLRTHEGFPILDEESIRAKVIELGGRIAADYAGRELTLVSVLKGSLPFMADLMRSIGLPLTIDLMEVSAYGGTMTENSGLVRIIKDLSSSIDGRDVLLVEDIIDTGLTLNYLMRYLRGKNPASLRICTLLDKPARRLVEIPVDYVGFTIPDQFVVGYGLDYGEHYRNLRYVGVLRPEVYST